MYMYEDTLGQTMADLLFPEMEAQLELMQTFLVIYILSMVLTLSISLAGYVLQSMGLYTIANRRGIRNPWLAWIPVAGEWILGCISDQYQYVVRGRVKHKRRTLLVLNIIITAAYVAITVLYIYLFVGVLGAGVSGVIPDEEAIGIAMSILGAGLLMLVTAGLAIAATVLRYMALYDLYKSCEPANAVMYLVLSIVVPILMPALTILQPLFIFLCRKKDGGMPPRKGTERTDVPPAPEPVETRFSSSEDYEWRPPAPERDPWENVTEE